MHLDAEGQDVGKAVNLVSVELVQNVDVSETLEDRPDGARVMCLTKGNRSVTYEIDHE